MLPTACRDGSLLAMQAGERRQPGRAPRAVAATAELEGLRGAYLELLKLSLCDLAGPSTVSVWKHTDGTLLSRELGADELDIRVAGVDWPLHGTTMAGLQRLDDLQTCVEAVVRDERRGRSDRGRHLARRRFDPDAGDARRARRADRTVWVADSFQGFPTADEALAPIDYLAVPVDDVRANFARFGLRPGRALRRGLLRGHAARADGPALVGGAARRRHVRGDVDDAAGALSRGCRPAAT